MSGWRGKLLKLKVYIPMFITNFPLRWSNGSDWWTVFKTMFWHIPISTTLRASWTHPNPSWSIPPAKIQTQIIHYIGKLTFFNSAKPPGRLILAGSHQTRSKLTYARFGNDGNPVSSGEWAKRKEHFYIRQSQPRSDSPMVALVFEELKIKLLKKPNDVLRQKLN